VVGVEFQSYMRSPIGCACACECVRVERGTESCFEVFTLLCFYPAYVGSCLTTFRERLSVTSSSVKQFKNNCSTLEDGIDRLTRNVGKQLPTYAV
jgi:hypothetical protein